VARGVAQRRSAAADAHTRAQGVFVRTQKNVLFKVNPSTRLPRTFKRFCGLMGAWWPRAGAEALSALRTLTRPLRPQCNCCRSSASAPATAPTSCCA
jgi:hypothetical protein